MVWSAQQSSGREGDLGEALDVSQPDAVSIQYETVTPMMIGEPRDADPIAGAIWQTELMANTAVRDIGPPLTVFDETTEPLTIQMPDPAMTLTGEH